MNIVGIFFFVFQFHNGTIKTLTENEIKAIYDYFNSIMVQLKHN